MLLASVVTGLLVMLVWSALERRWETNDDPAMMMLAHGFGIAAESTSQLVFSNVIWGHALSWIPWIAGIPGYPIASAVALLTSCFAITYALIRMGLPMFVCGLAVALCLVRPLLWWQFTMIAGLLAVGGVLLLLASVREQRKLGMALSATALLFVAMLVRSSEAVLVLAIASPLLTRRELLLSRHVHLCFAMLVIASGLAHAVNTASYRGADWERFRQFDEVRVPITDFQAGARLRAAPQALARNQLEMDEVRLIEAWGFVCPDVTEPDRLRSALAEIGAYEHREGALAGVSASLNALFRPNLLWLTAAAFGLLVARCSPRPLLCWCAMLSAVGLLGAMGRPGVERVYLPILVLMILAPLATVWTDPAAHGWKSWRRIVAMVSVGIAAVFHLPNQIDRARVHSEMFTQYRSALDNIGEEDLIVWGARFPYEFVYSPLRPIPWRATSHLGLGALTYAPGTHTWRDEQAGRSLLSRMRTPKGALVAATDFELQLLRNYLARRFDETLESQQVLALPRLQVQRWRIARRSSGSEP